MTRMTNQKRIKYPCVATSVEGFIQQIAQGFVVSGFCRFYVRGEVPEWYKPEEFDREMVKKFNTDLSASSRCRRRKRRGPNGRYLACCRYIRYGSVWALFCQKGGFEEDEADFFELHTERDALGRVTEVHYHDVRKVSFKFRGYSVGYCNEKLTVQLTKDAYLKLRKVFLDQALSDTKGIIRDFRRFPFVAWGGVIKQKHKILKAVNKKRIAAQSGLKQIFPKQIKVKRRQVKPFGRPPAPVLVFKRDVEESDLRLAA